jgi:sensor histidine kinase YesM
MYRTWNFPKTKLSFKILFNLILWGLYIGLPLLSPVHQEHALEHPHPHRNPEFTEHIWLELSTVVPLFYLITQVLIPYVFKKKGVWYFFGYLFLLNLLFLGIQFIINNTVLAFEGPLGEGLNLKGFFPLIMISGIASTYGLLLEFIERESKTEDLKNEQMRAELSFLRSQISPHFIFNILNSIVYLIRTKADKKAEDVTIRLSSLMRYMLYDSDQSMVPLDREVDYVQNYIDLQRMRFEDDVQIEFEVKGTMDGSMIEPMLLIPFVENAFKHGVGFVRDPYIKVQLIYHQGSLDFQVENKMGKLVQDQKEESSGIGLKNVTRRLELLYPGKHQIKVNQDDTLFKVQLHMGLHQKN